MFERAIVIHGHFYQPPRENPWLEAVEVQDAAAPYHDWNERVTAECYGPNTAARRVDAGNRVLDIVNNFEKISFNVGPTLMAWLFRHRGDIYAKILEADGASRARLGGHGNAIAQVYNHMIMPLATRRDRVTQIRWGLGDFRARFGREPEGMWLPEMAVDTDTLQALAGAGLAFTVLAPHQARRVRRMGTEEWDVVNDRVDPTQPYLWRGAGGSSLAVFFYSEPVARAIAFGDALERGEGLTGWLVRGFADGAAHAQLVDVATDGETYGHHRKFGDMALAASIQQIEAGGRARLTNYGEYLAAHPPTHEVEIRERTSWSCVHGVERWRADCGCRVGIGTHQRWRGPLREALDWLRDQIDPLFEARASVFLKDPWEARDAYVEVILDREPERVDDWLARYRRGPLDGAARVETLCLLEMQRHRLLMYASCGWFFDEISALEPVQVLKYATMAMQYYARLGGGALETEFARRLQAAPSNDPELGQGAEVYRRLVRPAVVDLRRVVAHYAISGLFEEYPPDARIYAFRVRRIDEARDAYGTTAIRIAHVRVGSEITGATEDAEYALLHFGGHDFSCAVRGHTGAEAYAAMKADLMERYARYSLADVVRGLDERFGAQEFSLAHLFLEERRRVLAGVVAALFQEHEDMYRHIWTENRKLAHYLRRAETPLPPALALVAKHVLEQSIVAELGRHVPLRGMPARVRELTAEARTLGLTLDLSPVRPIMRGAVREAIQAVAAEPTAERATAAVALIEGAKAIGARFGLWGAQNQFFELWREARAARPRLLPLASALNFRLD